LRKPELANSLQSTHPILCEEWDTDANSKTPAGVSQGSDFKANWICRKDSSHRWSASVSLRVRGTGCPYCSGRMPIFGKTDLGTVNPKLSEEWHPTLNLRSLPQDFTPKSGKKVWWFCKRGHSWEATIASRASGRGCPVCVNKLIVPGVNDLLSQEPGIAAWWDYERNSLSPSEFSRGSRHPAYWICDKGHGFQRPVYQLTKGRGCPTCPRVKKQDINQELLKPFLSDYKNELNDDIRLYDRSPHSRDKILWTCGNNHIWSSMLRTRVRTNCSCPFCLNPKLQKENVGIKSTFKSVQEAYPELVPEWDFKENDLSPDQVLSGSSKSFRWICMSGHSFIQSPRNRGAGRGCPYCSGRLPLAGKTDLGSVAPEVAVQWDYAANNGLTPEDFLPNSAFQANWQCQLGHKWSARISSRTKGNGCPICANKIVLEGFNDLFSVRPELEDEWDWTRNSVSPLELFVSSPRRVWWLCEKGHSWEMSPNGRRRGEGCPSCSPGGFSPSRPSLIYALENRSLRSYKVGITFQGSGRVEKFKMRKWEEINTWQFEDGNFAQAIETLFFSIIRSDLSLPPFLGEAEMSGLGGWTETFSSESMSRSELIDLIEQCVSETQV
jgi:hypothetical protein